MAEMEGRPICPLGLNRHAVAASMILKIRSTGDPVLRQPARLLTVDEILVERTQELIASMRETMRDAPGVGLAAPQVGVALQLAVIEDREEYMKDLSVEQLAERERKPVPFHAIINPVLIPASESTLEFFEGCLSIPGFTALVPRAPRVRVECLDHNGQPHVIDASGWYARILQHEIDHLRGALYIDHMHSTSFTTLDNHRRNAKDMEIGRSRPER
jgi:peptide deformylase